MALKLKPTGKPSLDRKVVAAACMEFWEWADSETTDGHLKHVTADFIDSLVELPGFWRAIEEQGWVRATARGISIPNWDRHNGMPAKRRAQDVVRKQVVRARPQDVRIESGQESDQRRSDQRREEDESDQSALGKLRAWGVGEPALSTLGGAAGVTADLVTEEWELSRRARSPVGCLIRRLEARLGVKVPAHNSLAAIVNGEAAGLIAIRRNKNRRV